MTPQGLRQRQEANIVIGAIAQVLLEATGLFPRAIANRGRSIAYLAAMSLAFIWGADAFAVNGLRHSRDLHFALNPSAQTIQHSEHRDSGVTLATYHQLEFGMSLTAVRKIAGSAGSRIRPGAVAPGILGETYEWQGAKPFAAMRCKFKDGKLIGKIASNLE